MIDEKRNCCELQKEPRFLMDGQIQRDKETGIEALVSGVLKEDLMSLEAVG